MVLEELASPTSRALQSMPVEQLLAAQSPCSARMGAASKR
jgi:hypothetical protein